MPTFRNSLPAGQTHRGFDLRRTPATGTLCGIVTCEKLLVCDTHYWHGRTTPCERTTNDEGKTIDDNACDACVNKTGYRTHVYVSAWDAKRQEHFLFECTANAAIPFADYAEALGTLRGCAFHATRAKPTANSKVLIQTQPANTVRMNLPPEPNIARALAVIWRLPLNAAEAKTSTTCFEDEEAIRPTPTSRASINNRLTRKQRTQPDNIPDPPTAGELLHQLDAALPQGNGQKT